MNFIRYFHEIGRDDLPLVGGKGLSLGLLSQAGLPVPAGFVITTAAHEIVRNAVDKNCEADVQAVPRSNELDNELQREILQAYEQLGPGLVAVRSSATAEDGAAASFAGQQETILGVQGKDSLLAAIKRCWASLHSARSQAYRARQTGNDRMSMAVVVQRLVDALRAGVLFTRNPLDVSGETMLVEASWGLGEAVVSGRVTPDRYQIDRETGELRDQQIQFKKVVVTAAGIEEWADDIAAKPCLYGDKLRELAAIGHQIETYFGEPRDVEWAWHDGKFWVLQARPITTAGALEREELRRELVGALRAKAALGGTVWAKYNLAEILPAPTPMTWAIVSQFMSGQGGYGRMYRRLGYDPDPIIDEEGFIDLVCGRPYVNLSREPKLYFRDFPYVHNFAAIKANPQTAMYPQPTVDPAGRTARFWCRLPAIAFHMLRVQSRAKRLGESCGIRLREKLFPAFAAEVATELKTDYAAVSPDDLLKRLENWRAKTLDEFASESLQPTVFAALALAELERKLASILPAPEAAAGVQSMISSMPVEDEFDFGHALKSLSLGKMNREEFLERFGHRGPNEMELAEPRWSEIPEKLPRAAVATSHSSAGNDTVDLADGRDLYNRHDLESKVRQTVDFIALREAAKHHLMLGYFVLRRILLELDRCFRLDGGVYYLTPEELPQLVAGKPMEERIRLRRQRRMLALTLEVPPVLFSDDLEAIGRPLPVAGGEELQGTPVSAGVAEGVALVCDEPWGNGEHEEGFILVCPSTDPAWVPMFLHARGLVMETGGILSHGAIVAREFHLPAVAGIANIQRTIRTGQRLRVDGNTGRVHVFAD